MTSEIFVTSMLSPLETCIMYYKEINDSFHHGLGPRWNLCEPIMCPKFGLGSNCTKHFLSLLCMIEVLEIYPSSMLTHPNSLRASINECTLSFDDIVATKFKITIDSTWGSSKHVEFCERKYIQNLLDKSSWIPKGIVQKDGIHTTWFENITNNLVQPWCSYLERIEFFGTHPWRWRC
jgi:hypothetical protein